MEDCRFDKDDWRIIRLLNLDGRRSSASISRELELPPRTVRNRIERLVESGAIRPTAMVDHERFGYQIVVDVLCEAEGNQLEEIGQTLARLGGTRYVAYRIGDDDISVQILLHSPDEVGGLQTFFEQLPGMHQIKVIPLQTITKNTHDWVPPELDFRD